MEPRMNGDGANKSLVPTPSLLYHSLLQEPEQLSPKCLFTCI